MRECPAKLRAKIPLSVRQGDSCCGLWKSCSIKRGVEVLRGVLELEEIKFHVGGDVADVEETKGIL